MKNEICVPRDSRDLLELCKNDVSKCRAGLAKQFIKLGGRNFGAYQSKKIDQFMNLAYNALKERYFDEFSPNDEQIPLCVIAIDSYAFCEVSIKSRVGLDVNARIYELGEIFERIKDDLETKTMFAQFRFVCGSKKLYLLARETINELKNYKKAEFIKYHLSKLSPILNVKFLSQRPDLKNGYGGFYDYKRIFWLLNSAFQNPKLSMLRYMSEDKIAALNLSADFVSSLRSALGINGGEDVLESHFVSGVAKLMQIKEKKTLSALAFLVVKTLFAMQNIALFSRFLARASFREPKLGFSARKSAKFGRFFVIENKVFLPLNSAKFSLAELLSGLNSLPDRELEFSAEVALKMQMSQIERSSRGDEFVQILCRAHSYGILKALLDGEILFNLIKPMERTRHLARIDGHKISVDEYSLLCVYYVENIRDDFISSLYNTLNSDEKAVLKLALVMHEAAWGLGGDHSVSGGNIFRAYAAKIGLGADLISLGVAIIKNQSSMSNLASKNTATTIF